MYVKRPGCLLRAGRRMSELGNSALSERVLGDCASDPGADLRVPAPVDSIYSTQRFMYGGLFRPHGLA